MSSNQQTAPDISSLTLEDLQDEYFRLFDNYQDLRKVHDDDAQQIYELKRSLQTATAAEAYLSQELEQVSQSQNSEVETVQQKFQHEIDDFKRKYVESESYSAKLELNAEEMRQEIAKLMENIVELKQQAPVTKIVECSNESLEREVKLEKENMELFEKIEEYQDNLNKYMMGIAEREKQIEILKDRVECLDENLQSKKNELEEKTGLLESTQEQMIELNAQIAMYKSAPENEDRKGNSLFAEVDDQRQVMKRLLNAQKKNYVQMKKVYNESEFEIRRLKRENIAMHTELQACANLFLSADRLYKEKLNERIVQLLKQNEQLQNKLNWTQEKLSTLANDKGINWLDSMFTFCKKETKELQAQLHSSRVQKGILDEKLRNSQQDMAKWRFEALKSRCIIIDRESLLEENKIKFKIFKHIDFKITTKEQESATPKIISAVVPEKKDVVAESNDIVKNEPNISVQEPKNIQDGAINSTESYLVKNEPNLSVNETKHIQDAATKSNKYVHNQSTDTVKNDPNKLGHVTQNTQDMSNSISESAHSQNPDVVNNSPLLSCNETKIIPEKSENSYMKFETCANSLKHNSSEFEVYEDTTESFLSFQKQEIKHEDSLCIPHKLSHHKPTNTEQKGLFEIYEDTTQSVPLVSLNSISTQSPTVKNDNLFEIYEDTTTTLTCVRTESLMASKENNYKENSSANTVRELKLSPAKDDLENKPSPSILVKSRDILSDAENAKGITFSADVKDINREDKPHKAYAKTTRTKSNIIIRKIIINSNPTKK